MTSNTNEMDPRIRIRAPLRCDGVGSLDCAEDTESGVRMAVRWLPVDANGEAAAQAVSTLPEHPVLPRIRQTGRVGTAAYVAMEFPEGRLLATLVGEALRPVPLLELAAALADALAALHEEGMVHGELSPESVLMLPEGRAILWDVPLVMADRLTDRRGEDRAMANLARVAPYLSPERARGLPPSSAADVYALASTLCTAGGGLLPPSGSTLGVVHRIATADWIPEVPEALPPAARALVARMLTADPLARQSARQMAVAFAALLAEAEAAKGTPLSIAPPPIEEMVARPPPLPLPAISQPGVAAPANDEVADLLKQRAHRRVVGWGVAAGGAAAVLALVVVALLGTRAPATDSAPPSPEAQARPEAAPEEEPGHWEEGEDVGDFVSPLVGGRGDGARSSRRRRATYAAAPAAASPGRTERTEPARAEVPAAATEPAPGDWNFLPTGAPAPTSELKRPKF